MSSKRAVTGTEGQELWARGQALDARGGRGRRGAVALFRRGVALGDVDCMASLAYHLDGGYGVRRDQLAARRLWARAARLGDALSAGNVGLSFKHEQRYGQAMRWFAMAERLGDDSAGLERGKLWLFGLGVRRDVKRGEACVEAAIASETLS